jgi:hypothetical protein
MITCLGRSGTTLLMELLKCHPEVLVQAPYPYETRCATYWMHMAKVLSEPGSPLPTVDWISYFANDEHVRPNLFYNDSYLANPTMMGWMNDNYGPRTVEFCMASLDDFYDAAAKAEGREGAQAFAEKQYPGRIANVINEISPGAREIFCVRDPRDVLMSVSASIKKPGVAIFGHAGDIGIHDLARRLRDDWANLVEDYDERGRSAHLVRYEDLVSRPQDTLREMLTYADLAAGEALVEKCVQTGFSDTVASQGHRTINLEQSVGRWKQELDDDTQGLVNDLFADAISTFGYDD